MSGESCSECDGYGVVIAGGEEVHCATCSLRAEVERLRNEIYETTGHVLFLLDSYHLWSEDKVFTMPDGWTYNKEARRER